MKKNQSGVSLITLVITIIVVIILAMVAFGNSLSSIGRGNYAAFVSNVKEIQGNFTNEATYVIGEDAIGQTTRTKAQGNNFLAKGASLLDDEVPSTLISGDQTDRDLAWLPRGIAEGLACTQLNPKDMKDAIGMTLPKIKVNTDAATGIECSFFVTRTGTVFVWPPFEHENEYYVNGDIKVAKSGESITIKADGTGTTQPSEMYAPGFEFMVDGVGIKVLGTDQLETEQGKVKGSATTAEIAEVATIFYTDSVAALSPVGLESDSKVDSPDNSGGSLTPANTNMMYNIASGTGDANQLGAIVPRTTANFQNSKGYAGVID